jgi:hypothetical protein
MIKFFKKLSIYNLLLTVFLIGVLIGALVIWIFGGKNYTDFGLNLFTEMLGVLITIFVIDYLVKRREHKKQLPIKASIYKDTFKFFGQYITIFHSSYVVSVPDELPENLEDFISENGIGKVFKYLDLNTKPRITPERTWFNYFQERRNSILNLGNTFLERYKGFTEPEVFNAIHTLINGTFLGTLGMMPTIMKVQSNKDNNYIMSFDSFHVHFSKEEYQALNILNNWIKKNYRTLKKFDATIPKYKFKTEFHTQDLSCKLPNELIRK